MAKATADGGLPSATFAAGERLIRRPRHSAELAVRAQVLDRLSLGGSLTYLGTREDVDFNQFPSQRVELTGYATVDLAAELQLLRPAAGHSGISGVVRVENVFNQQFDEVVGFPGRRRGVFGGVKVRL